MTVTVPSYNPILFEGLSTDTKPDTWDAPGNNEQAVPTRSTFIETDTGDEYIYTGSSWIKEKESGVGIVNISQGVADLSSQVITGGQKQITITDLYSAQNKILKELKIMNIHLSLMTDTDIKHSDVD